jgi:hypothetical protein
MLLEYINYYSDVIYSFTQQPLYEVGIFYSMGTALLAAIVIIKELTKD